MATHGPANPPTPRPDSWLVRMGGWGKGKGKGKGECGPELVLDPEQWGKSKEGEGAKSEGPRAKGQGPRAKGQEARAKGQEARAKGQEARAKVRSWSQIQGKSQEPRTKG